MIVLLAGSLTWSPAAVSTEIPTTHDMLDLRSSTGARAHVEVTTALLSGAQIAIQCSPDGTTWTIIVSGIAVDVTGMLSGPTLARDLVAIPAPCRVGDAHIRAVSAGGNGVAVAVLGGISVEFR